MITHWLVLIEEGVPVDLDAATGARVRDFRDARVDAGGFRPELRLANAGDLVLAARDHTNEPGAAAPGDVDGHAGDVGIREEQV